MTREGEREMKNGGLILSCFFRLSVIKLNANLSEMVFGHIFHRYFNNKIEQVPNIAHWMATQKGV